MLQNAYLLAKNGADTAENEQHFAEILPKCRAERADAVPELSVALEDADPAVREAACCALERLECRAFRWREPLADSPANMLSGCALMVLAFVRC